MQTTAKLGLRSSHDNRFLFFGPEHSHFSGTSFWSKLVLLFFGLFHCILLIHLLFSHEFDRILHPLMYLLLAVEATHATILYLNLLLSLFAILGIDIDVVSADFALGMAVEEAVPAPGLSVAAPLLLLPHLPELF